jgi:WhiB family redox-sensing transcriptional regulator
MSTPTRLAMTDAAPLTDDWRAYAACASVDPEIFFPVGYGREARRQTADAKAVCQRCPSRTACLKWALETGQHAGVWGGLSEDERSELSSVQESSMTRCMNRQDWIEEQLAAGKPQKAIARELGVYSSLLCRAIQRFNAERAAGFAAGVDAA